MNRDNYDNYKYGRYISSDDESRWADPEELKNASTLMRIDVTGDSCRGCGLPIICDGRIAYVDNSDTHTMVIGATGSKKTRLFGMSLINIFALAGESFIATDPKGELYQKTSGLVADRGYNIITLNLRDFCRSSHWNPLKLIYDTYHSGVIDEAISLMNDFITSISEPFRKGAKDPYWIEMGRNFALPTLQFFIDTAKPDEANIYNFAKFFAAKSTSDETEKLAKYIAEGSVAYIYLMLILTNKEAKSTFGNIASEVSAMLSPFILQKTLSQVLSRSSFDIRSPGKEKTGIYIIVPDEKTSLHFLISTFIKQIYEVLINDAQQQDDNKLPLRVNFLLDEFANIPTITDFHTMISASRSRNMRFYLLIQGMHQLKQKYEDDAETIKGNCENIVFLNSREYGLLEEISKLCGTISYYDINGNIRQRPLISVSELQRLKKEKGEALILHGRHYPFVSTLPDIDDYMFKTYPPAESECAGLPEIVPYNADAVFAEIRNRERHLPFSPEVFGEETFYEESDTNLDW